MTISLIITTSPRREDNLEACLLQLTRQTYQAFEIIVVDDGSERGEAVIHAFKSKLPLKYFWRPNDLCPARSRNLGAGEASQTKLVFLDSDVLLNPEGLAVYQRLLERYPNRLWGGYFGSVRDYRAPSLFLPDRIVNYLDKRFEVFSRFLLQTIPTLETEPAWRFWSANMAANSHVFSALKGFDESFKGWGNEDNEFAFRALQAGYEIHFSLSAWAEHQVHSHKEVFHEVFYQPGSTGEQFANQAIHPSMNYALRIEGQPLKAQYICQQILEYYAQQDPGIPAQAKAQFYHAQAALSLQMSPHDN